MSTSPNYFLPGYINTCEKAGMLKKEKALDNMFYAFSRVEVNPSPGGIKSVARLVIALNCVIAALGLQEKIALEVAKIMAEIERSGEK